MGVIPAICVATILLLPSYQPVLSNHLHLTICISNHADCRHRNEHNHTATSHREVNILISYPNQ